jgi:hypothetical protein
MTDPELIAARARVAATFERFTRLDLQVIVLGASDSTRRRARDQARRAAVQAGRGDLLAEATESAREMALRAFARAGFSGTWAATDMAASVATAGDRVAAAAALEEATMAAVVEDLVDADTLDVLRSSFDELDRSTGMPSPGALSAFAAAPVRALDGSAGVAVATLYVGICVAIWLVLGPGFGLAAIALGVGVAATARHRVRSDP